MRSVVVAGLALALTGCELYFGDHHAADAASGPDSALQLVHVTITVTGENVPFPGAIVYFQNADSSLVEDTTTDVNGDASADMAPGGDVTAIVAGVAYTYIGIDSDDHLHLAIAPQPTSGRITMNVTVPVDNSAYSYQ